MLTFSEFLQSRKKPAILEQASYDVLLHQIAKCGQEISLQLRRSGFLQLGQAVGIANVQSEEVLALDLIANNMLINEIEQSGAALGIASEEMEDIHVYSAEASEEEKFVVLFDPLDGSSNIEVLAPVGTIFSIYAVPKGEALTLKHFLQAGREVIGAGYILYGSSTMLVYAEKGHVNGFTLDVDGIFKLSHENIQTPKTAHTFSVNQASYHRWPEAFKKFVDWCGSIDNKKVFSQRYIGSMVADFHRNLIKGGIFLYPPTTETPKGRLRLMYECIPLSFIQHQAGGLSTDMVQSILDIEPKELHQRTSVAIGSYDLIQKLLSM